MKKIILTTAIVSGISLAALQVLPALAEKSSEPKIQKEVKTEIAVTQTTDISSLRKHQQSDINPLEHEKIASLIKEAGITTEGKDLQSIMNELTDYLIQKKATEAGVSTVGKDQETLIQELQKYDEENSSNKKFDSSTLRNSLRNSDGKIDAKAKELGIDTSGKSAGEITNEIQDKVIHDKAKTVGITTEGKTRDEILAELESKLMVEEAAKYGIDTTGKSKEQIQKELKEAIIKAQKK